MVIQTVGMFGIAFVVISASIVVLVDTLPALRRSSAADEDQENRLFARLTRPLALNPRFAHIVVLGALVLAAAIAVPLSTRASNAHVATAAASSGGPSSSASVNAITQSSQSSQSLPSSKSLPSSPASSPASPSASVGYDGPAICAPTTDAATSGGSPATLMRSAIEVASGTIEGKPWSLWSTKGQSGAAGLEDGGVVFNGREYGLCPGYPNPSETEMIDTGGDAVIYGIVNYPGLATVQVSTGSINSFAVGTVLPSPHVTIVNGVAFYIGTLPQSACSYSYFEINTTSPSYSAEHNIGFGQNGVGQGYSITNNPGNVGTCVSGRLDPLSYSEGVWQLPPGQFQSNFGGGGASTGSGSASSVNVPNDTSNCSPTANPSSSGGPPSALTSTGTEVASGTVQGQVWSLWSAKGQSGANGIENGGLVLDGRAYGLCPGYPNPAELQLIDVGSNGVVAGVVGYPGLAKIVLSESSAGTFDVGQALPSPSVRPVDGVSFFIGTLPESACDYSSLELNTTSPGVSAEHNLGFGTCVANELVPITESQGVWQLPPGQFQGNF
jgi:hypothetical protein